MAVHVFTFEAHCDEGLSNILTRIEEEFDLKVVSVQWLSRDVRLARVYDTFLVVWRDRLKKVKREQIEKFLIEA